MKIKELIFHFFFFASVGQSEIKEKIIEEDVQAFINKKDRAYWFKSYCRAIEF